MAKIDAKLGAVTAAAQKSSKSTNVRDTVISRVSTVSKPAPTHNSWRAINPMPRSLVGAAD